MGEIVDDVDKCMFSGQQESHGRVGWSYKKAVWRSYYLARPTGGEACKLWCQHSRYTNINKQTNCTFLSFVSLSSLPEYAKGEFYISDVIAMFDIAILDHADLMEV